MKLTGAKILLLPLPAEDVVSEGGIILKEETQKTTDRGVVIEIGPGRRLPPHNEISPVEACQVGDRVIFNPPYGMDVFFEGKRMVVTSEEHIIAVLEPGEK
jgi:co-chaperonin GroES (HSP10)